MKFFPYFSRYSCNETDLGGKIYLLVWENEEDTPGKKERICGILWHKPQQEPMMYCAPGFNKEIQQTLNRSLRLATKLLTVDCIMNLRLLMLRIICWIKRTEFSSTSPNTLLSAILDNKLSERRLEILTVGRGVKFDTLNSKSESNAVCNYFNRLK